MKNTNKKNIKSKNKKIKKNNTTKKNKIKKCMEKFVEKKIKYWTNDLTKEINILNNKKITNEQNEQNKLLTELKKKRKERLSQLKKQYKLYNCNIDCKNTLLEPGLPNKIPESMSKEYKNSKKLITIFNNQRKSIFKDKTNVLIDNFYEYTPNKIKKQLIKEGAISQCLPMNYNNQIGGSIIMKDGNRKKTNETYNGKPFFRKVFYYSNPPNENQIRAANAEFVIANILINNPNPNIVTFYDINKEYVEMEELDITTKLDQKILIESMEKAKSFLQSLGIMYIDWKKDNVGIGNDGTYKLFDFDVSGLIDLKTNEWLIKPLEYWSYNKSIENGYLTPKQIDDFSFNYGIKGIKNQ